MHADGFRVHPILLEYAYLLTRHMTANPRIRLKHLFIIIILILTVAPARAQSRDGALKILEADEGHLLLELILPSFDLETVIRDGVPYQRVQVPGWSHWGQPGYPQLPMYSVPLGLPRPGEPQITIVEADSQVTAVDYVYPAPALSLGGTDEAPQVVETFALDADAYGADTLYPGGLTEATGNGFLRDQPLFQLRLYPFQYNPTLRELTVYRRLRVLVTFPPLAPGAADIGRTRDSPIFEKILEQTLFNYDWLPKPQFDGVHAADNGATYVIITHPDFYDAVQALKTYRESQGETVSIAKTDDIYDAYNSGVQSAEAIRAFLEHAYATWSPRPVYVLLVGDASSDPSLLPDLLPTYYVDTLPFGQAPTDAWYAKIHGSDDYPDVIIGRVPARSPGEVTTAINKVLIYEQSPPPGEWLQRAVLVADDGDPAFQGDMEMVADLLPEDIVPTKMYAYDPNTSVQDQIGAGALLVAYSGHGNTTIWGSWSEGGRIYQQSYIADLWNGNKLPFMTVGNCYNGRFSDATQARNLAEEFLLVEDRGGIAAWAPSGLSFPTIDTLMFQVLYETLFVDDDLILGSATTTARIRVHLEDPSLPLAHIEIFAYFGDPALRLNMPDDPPGASFTSSSPDVLGQTTTFQSTSTGTNLSYEWDFGDGSPPAESPATTITHTYTATGTYSVSLTASNNAGSDVAFGTVEIEPSHLVYLPLITSE
jgi:PKD repeat protein